MPIEQTKTTSEENFAEHQVKAILADQSPYAFKLVFSQSLYDWVKEQGLPLHNLIVNQMLPA